MNRTFVAKPYLDTHTDFARLGLEQKANVRHSIKKCARLSQWEQQVSKGIMEVLYLLRYSLMHRELFRIRILLKHINTHITY